MARKQRAEQRAKSRRQREEEDRQQRVMIITEFDAGDPEATMHALAAEIPALGDLTARFYPARVWAGELGANQTRHALFATSNQ